jgi:hypothetical protein
MIFDYFGLAVEYHLKMSRGLMRAQRINGSFFPHSHLGIKGSHNKHHQQKGS